MKTISPDQFDLISGGAAFVLSQINGSAQVTSSAGTATYTGVTTLPQVNCTPGTNVQQFVDGTIQRGEGALLAAGGLAVGLRSGNFTPGTNAAMALGVARFANGVYLQQTANGKACVQ